MSRYIGNYLRVPSLEPQQASAPGIWSLSEQLNYQRANLWPPARDPYYNQTVLHLSGDVAGTRETNPVTQPRTFLSDASSNNFLLTPNGDVSAKSFNPYLNNYSNYFDGASGTYLSIANSSVLDQSGDFTQEAWYCRTGDGFGTVDVIYIKNITNFAYIAVTQSTGIVTVNQHNVGALITGTTATIAGIWYHLAVTRSSNSLRLFVNGVQEGGTVTYSTNTTGSATSYIGGFPAAHTLLGYLSNIRVTNTAVYTSNFTPPTQPLQNISGISLLTCQSNRFRDVSSNGFTITPNGTTAVAQNSPFVEYDTTSGSGYFDGSDWLSTPDNAAYTMGAGDFTVEAWVYCTAADFASSRYIIAQRNSSADTSISFAMNLIGGGTRKVRLLCFDTGGASYEALCASDVINLNEWTHIAGVRNGTTLRIYVNGVQQGTANISTASLVDSDGGVAIGRLGDANFYYWLGYISNVRVTKGGCLYPSGTQFPPPTAPLTTNVSAGTVSLLTLQTRAPANNQGILDTSPNSLVVTRNGNVAQGSFSPFSASGYSVSTTATNTLDLPGSVLAFGSSSFTVEAWVYATHTSGAPIVYPYNSGNAVTSGGFSIGFGTTNIGYYAVNGPTPINYNATFSLNTWYHLALVKDGTAARLYVDGQLVTTGTDSTTYTTPTGGARVGGIYNLTQTYGLVVNNLRIVTGQALYNANFTPATKNLTANVIGHQGLENTAITGTVRILTARDPYRIDRSSNNHTIGSSGSPQFLPISPFAPTQAYVASQLGGSAYFDASGDSIAITSSIVNPSGTEDFTLEFWFYHAMSSWPGGFLYYINGTGSGTFGIYYNNVQNEIVVQQSGVTQIINTAVSNTPLNQWNHYALVRSSNSWAVWINGTRTSGPITNSTSFNAATGFSISPTNTYISGFRIVKQPLYLTSQSIIPVPTAPPQAINNTTTLLNFTGAGIIDSTGRNNLETVGNSAVQTKTIQYGTGSMYFDGSDYLIDNLYTNQNYAFGSGNWTIEGWFYNQNVSGSSGNVYLISIWGIVGQADTTYSQFVFRAINNNLDIVLQPTGGAGLTLITGTGNGLTANTWQHLAAVRNGNNVSLYINGTSVASTPYTATLNNPASRLVLGAQLSGGAGTYYYTGYMDDIRITKGIARYTTNFNTNLPPGPFPLA